MKLIVLWLCPLTDNLDTFRIYFAVLQSVASLCMGLGGHGPNIVRCDLLDNQQGLIKLNLSSWPPHFRRTSDALLITLS